ncbi:hypothetical protein WJX84_010402 [Apatococcus fuscideae]|uniref:GATA-type domain-containing protein n=1 Tax=Apatococcus fuscideae TaxID=2026836 RepID=A0AAW1SIP6_9CHLO
MRQDQQQRWQEGLQENLEGLQRSACGTRARFQQGLRNLSQHQQPGQRNLERIYGKADPFAALIPGNSAAEQVLTSGFSSTLSLYNTAIIGRLLLTWFPNPPAAIASPLATLCDPYLNLFRGLIPPIGGTLDLSPILALVVLDLFTNTAGALPAEMGPDGKLAARKQRFQLTSPTKAHSTQIFRGGAMEGPSLTTSSDLGLSVSTNRVSQQDFLPAERPATPGTQPTNALSQGPKACVQCGQTKTPLWRSGPAGPKTLCNACGVHYQRTVRRSKSSTPRAVSKTQADHSSGDPLAEEDAIRYSAKRSAQPLDDHMAPISTASEPESQQVSKRPRRQRRRKIPSSPPYERTTDRTFGSEGFNRLDTLVAAAGEETDWQVREEDDHSGQTTQRESADEDAMQEGKLHAQIDELSMQLEAKEEAHRLAMEEKLAAIASLNGVIKELLTTSLKSTEAIQSEKGSQIEQLQLGLQKQINVSLALQDLYTRSHQHYHQHS